jgi:hypothetical protein
LWQNQFVFNNGSFVPFSDTFKTKPFAQKLTDLESFYVPGNFYEHAGASKFTHWISDYTSLNSENNVYKMPSNWANEGTEEDVIEKATELYGFKENSVIDFGDKEADFSKMSIAVFKQPSTITLIQIKNADGTLVKNLKINDFDGTKLTSENFKGVSVNSSFNSIKPGIAVGPQNNFEQSVVVGVFASLAVLAAAIAVIYGCYNGYKKLNQTFSSSNQEEPGGSQGLDIKNIDNKVKNNSNGQAGNIQQGSPQQKKKRGEISLGGNSKF